MGGDILYCLSISRCRIRSTPWNTLWNKYSGCESNNDLGVAPPKYTCTLYSTSPIGSLSFTFPTVSPKFLPTHTTQGCQALPRSRLSQGFLLLPQRASSDVGDTRSNTCPPLVSIATPRTRGFHCCYPLSSPGAVKVLGQIHRRRPEPCP